MPAVSLSQLESHLWKAAWLLKGPVDAADFKTYIFPLLFFKRLSDVGGKRREAARGVKKATNRLGSVLKTTTVSEVSLEPVQPLLADEHLQHIVRAYHDFKDEPSFTRVVPIEEIRAEDGNLGVPLYVGGETQAQTEAAAVSATTALPVALAELFLSSQQARKSLPALGYEFLHPKN